MTPRPPTTPIDPDDVSALTVGPLLGSLITEPAAMTVTALVLRERYFGPESTRSFRYLTLATLLVNVSVGGVLTHFAAPGGMLRPLQDSR